MFRVSVKGTPTGSYSWRGRTTGNESLLAAKTRRYGLFTVSRAAALQNHDRGFCRLFLELDDEARRRSKFKQKPSQL